MKSSLRSDRMRRFSVRTVPGVEIRRKVLSAPGMITVSTSTDRIVDHCDPAFDGLAGYWKFEDDLTDESVYTNTGVFQGDPQFVANSHHGKALAFDGTDDLVDLGACGQGVNEQYWNVTGLSVMCWARSFEPTWVESAPGFVTLNDGLTSRSWGLRPNNTPVRHRHSQLPRYTNPRNVYLSTNLRFRPSHRRSSTRRAATRRHCRHAHSPLR